MVAWRLRMRMLTLNNGSRRTHLDIKMVHSYEHKLKKELDFHWFERQVVLSDYRWFSPWLGRKATGTPSILPKPYEKHTIERAAELNQATAHPRVTTTRMFAALRNSWPSFIWTLGSPLGPSSWLGVVRGLPTIFVASHQLEIKVSPIVMLYFK